MQGGFRLKIYEGDRLVFEVEYDVEFLSDAIQTFIKDIGGLDHGQELRISEI